jgi:hypothetical protein
MSHIDTLTKLYEEFNNDAIYLYCMLVIGYDESNGEIITSAFNKITDTNLKSELSNLFYDKMGIGQNDVDFLHENISGHVSYLALLFFVYASITAVEARQPASTNIRGLVMNPKQAIGWAYCLLNYHNGHYDPARIVVDTLQLSKAINIISIAIATRYIEQRPVKNTHEAFVNVENFTRKAPRYGCAMDIMYVARGTLDKIVFEFKEDYDTNVALRLFEEPISYIIKIKQIIGHPNHHRVYRFGGGRKQRKQSKTKKTKTLFIKM